MKIKSQEHTKWLFLAIKLLFVWLFNIVDSIFLLLWMYRTYSGTVAGAREAFFNGVPAVSVSYDWYECLFDG